MKKVLLFSMFFALALAAQAQNAAGDAITRFFNQYVEDERFTSVFVSPKMFQMVSKISVDDEDWEKIRGVVKDLTGLRVLSADSIANGMQLYKEALAKIPVSEYSELISVRDKGENVKIWTRDTGNVIHELLLLVGGPTKFTMLSFSGIIDLDKISNLAKALNVDGAEQLEKVKPKKKQVP